MKTVLESSGLKRLRMTQNRLIVAALLLLFTLFSSSCVTTQSVMQSWVGKPASELISNWGSPDSVSRLDDGRTVYTWVTISGDQSGVHQCRQSYTASAEGIIERWSFNNCPRLQRKW
jgi:hypothetical protein